MAEKSPIKQLVIDRPTGGWAYVQNSVVPTEGAEGQYSLSQFINPYRANLMGHISPGETFAPITDTNTYVNATPMSGVTTSDSTNNAWSVLENARLVNWDPVGLSTQKHFDVSGIFSSGTHNGHTLASVSNNVDVLSVKDTASTPNEGVLWSWEDGTDADIAMTLKGASDNTPTNLKWFSGATTGHVLTAGVPLRIWVGPDSKIYITNGQYIATATISGDMTNSANVTANYQALNLGVGWVASHGVSYGIYSAILAYKATSSVGSQTKSQSRLYLWDGSAANPNFVYDINDYYATALFNDNGILKIFTQGRDNKTRVKIFGGINYLGITGFQNLTEFPTSQIGASPYPGSVDLFRGILHWAARSSAAVGNAGIYMLDGKAFHQPMAPTLWSGNNNLGFTKVGMMKDMGGGAGLSVGISSTGPVYKIMTIQTGNYYLNAVWYSRLQTLPHKSTIRRVIVHFSQFSSASSVQVAILKGYGSSAIAGSNDLLKMTVNTTNFPSITDDLIATTAASQFSDNISNISSFYVGLNFNHTNLNDTAAVVRQIVIEYEPAPQL